MHESDGLVAVVVDGEETLLSSKFACPEDGFSYPEIEPRLFHSTRLMARASRAMAWERNIFSVMSRASRARARDCGRRRLW